MTQEEEKALKAENERLKKRIKHLEKRLARARGAHEQNEELQVEIETLEALTKPRKEAKRPQHQICPKCNGDLERMDAGPMTLILCTRPECKYTKTVKRK